MKIKQNWLKAKQKCWKCFPICYINEKAIESPEMYSARVYVCVVWVRVCDCVCASV